MAEDAQAKASTQAPGATAAVAEAKDNTPVYEVGFHIVPTVGDDGVGAVVEKVRKMLGDVEIISEGYPQKMTVSYVIERATAGKREKYSETYFGWIKFATTESASIPELEAKLLASKEVLRSIIIKTVREDITTQPRRAVFTSDRLEGETIAAPKRAPEESAPVSEAELDKSIEALTG